MKSLVLFFVIISFSTLADICERYPERPDYQIESKVKDSTLSGKKAKIIFHITTNYKHDEKSVIFADNGKQKTESLNDDFRFHHTSKAGKHVYEFFLSENFHEIRTDSIKIEGGYRYEIRINFKSSTHQINVRKPVIYLYPEESTDVNVKLDLKGELSFAYPAYDGEWNITADPDGSLHNGDDTFRYLFWESNQELDPESINTSCGFFVSNSELTSFLEEKLSAFGFNSEERADFITYWVPLMIDKKNLYIYFQFNDQCSLFADLKIEPKPAQIARFYMLWSEVDRDPEYLAKLAPQKIPAMDREGFTVLEWGGAELENLHFKAIE